ncbi:MAG: hypothetical protein AAFO69_18190, partial [Bacteroidota bacterium]
MKRLTLLMMLLCYYVSKAQDGGPDSDEFGAQGVPPIDQLVTIPPSPEAQAFTRYGNVENSLYTGTPNIQIPLTELKGRDMALPINLTYDASGLQVEKIATWVGFNWNLAVGGVITRQVHGLPDDHLGANPPYVPFYASPDFAMVRDENFMPGIRHSVDDLDAYFTFLNRHQDGQEETQPDAYSMSINGLSATFYVDYTSDASNIGIFEARSLDKPELKARVFHNQGNPIKVIERWEITDAYGNQYIFSKPETTFAYDGDGLDRQRTYHSSWYVSEIIAANNRDVINFEYTPPTKWKNRQLAGRGFTRMDRPVAPYDPCAAINAEVNAGSPEYQIAQIELQRIYINGKMRAWFVPDYELRKDLQWKKSLDKIRIYNQNEEQINEFDFEYSYFGEIDPVREYKSRLRLDALYERGMPGLAGAPKKHTFIYNEGMMPSRNSYAMDFWGFYNGKDNNETLISPSGVQRIDAQFSGADRTPSLEHTK